MGRKAVILNEGKAQPGVAHCIFSCRSNSHAGHCRPEAHNECRQGRTTPIINHRTTTGRYDGVVFGERLRKLHQSCLDAASRQPSVGVFNEQDQELVRTGWYILCVVFGLQNLLQSKLEALSSRTPSPLSLSRAQERESQETAASGPTVTPQPQQAVSGGTQVRGPCCHNQRPCIALSLARTQLLPSPHNPTPHHMQVIKLSR